MLSKNEFTWKLDAPVVNETDSPTTQFKISLQMISWNLYLLNVCIYKVCKTRRKLQFWHWSGHSKSFYYYFTYTWIIYLPRRPMFWENTADVQNISVSWLMSTNRFDEIMKNLHLADNSARNPNVKFSKVKPLIEKLNKQCLMQ